MGAGRELVRGEGLGLGKRRVPAPVAELVAVGSNLLEPVAAGSSGARMAAPVAVLLPVALLPPLGSG